MEWIKLKGVVRYDPIRKGLSTPHPWWCVIEVEEEISRYCRWFVNKERPLDKIHKPSWSAHITVIRGWKPKDPTVWGRHQGKEIDFWLIPFMRQAGDTTGWWDIFVHDRHTGNNEMVSVATDGTQGDDQPAPCRESNVPCKHDLDPVHGKTAGTPGRGGFCTTIARRERCEFQK